MHATSYHVANSLRAFCLASDFARSITGTSARDADRSGESIARNRHYPLKGGITINNGVLHLKICAKSRILEDVIKRKVSGFRKHFIIARASLSVYKDF